jgi:hypothetical protein
MSEYGTMAGRFDRSEEMLGQYVLHPASPSSDSHDGQGGRLLPVVGLGRP